MIFIHKVDVTPAHYVPKSIHGRYWGVHSCHIYFHCIGNDGSVQFHICPNWFTEAGREHLSGFPLDNPNKPTAFGIGYHSKYEIHEGDVFREKCDLTGGFCFSDEKMIEAENWLEGFIGGGTEWLWPKLEEYYRHIFYGDKYPDITPKKVKMERDDENQV